MSYRTINVAASRSYDIIIGAGVLSEIGNLIAPLLGKCRLAMLTDSNVDELYGDRIVEYLSSSGYAVD